MKATFRSLVHAVAEAEGQSQRRVAGALRRFFAELGEAVWASGRVSIPGLGTFEVRRRRARRVATPGDLHVMMLPESQVVVCRVAARWRRR